MDAAAYLYELYSIMGGMQSELKGVDFDKYMPEDAAKFYAEFNDANDFYEKGQVLASPIKSPVQLHKD